MNIDEKKICRNCKWFVELTCRRHAPTNNNPSVHLPQWPNVSWSDWCGDFQNVEQ